MKKTYWMTTAALTGLLTSSLAFAANRTFTVATQLEDRNVATVENETGIENFTGVTHKVAGTFQFDPTAKTGSGTLALDGRTIDTGVALRNEHMRSADWFDFDKSPEIKFVTTSVKFVSGDTYRIQGNLSLHGVTKAINATATVKLTAANDVTKMIGLGGDALAMVTKFKIKLSDFNIRHMAMDAGRVSNELTLTVKVIATDK